jgi:hypothetical protein
VNAQGLIEVIDLHTGRVLCVQRTAKDYLALKFEGLTRIETPQGPVFIEKGLDVDRVRRSNALAYSPVIISLIAEKITEGMSLMRACEEVGVKYSLVCAWRLAYEEAKAALEQARKDRAEVLAERALEKAEKSKRPYLEVETLKWAAEKGNPEKFGNQTTIKGDKNAPITFVLDTGIRRSGDTGFTSPGVIAPVVEEVKKVEEIGAWDVPQGPREENPGVGG